MRDAVAPDHEPSAPVAADRASHRRDHAMTEMNPRIGVERESADPLSLERHNIHVHDGGPPVVERAKAAGDRLVKCIGISDSLPIRTERAGDVDEAPLLALTPSAQPGQEGIRSDPVSGTLRPKASVHALEINN